MILAFNSGSSNLKFGCFDAHTLRSLAAGSIDWSGGARSAVVVDGDGAEIFRRETVIDGHGAAVQESLRLLKVAGVVPAAGGRSSLSAVGHRVVHGGTKFRASTVIDPGTRAAMRELAELAPLHSPPALEIIDCAGAELPGVPQIAVFDTAFFLDLPPWAYVYPLPYDWFTEWGIRRFGFHGLSHDYCARRTAELEPRREGLNLISCHLGNGCSATAVRDGKAVATTMGFTPLEGLMMGTRSGSIDPGILVYLARRKGFTADDIDDALNRQSGLLGVSGLSADFREVESAARQGNERAKLAFDICVDRVRASIGSLAVTLGSVDALIFTGGVGENSAGLRTAVCDGLQCLGIHLDRARNDACRADTNIAAAHSRSTIWVLHTREELMIAREAQPVMREVRACSKRPDGAHT